MSMRSSLLPKSFHDAVLRWRDTYLPDYDFLLDAWEKHFPREPRFELCAFRELGMCDTIECGDQKGRAKYTRAAEMQPEQAHHLFGAIRAQASTEFGSIQQHRLTLARAQHEEEQAWVLRMMVEELRHGYQMLHLLVEDDWSCVSQQSRADLVEDILSMQTGSHLLGAFNIDFDSFVDNVVFCALIDRVGKYQLAMQKVSAYQPMAESMPQMLREEAFHLMTGVVPMRRWAEQAARGQVYVTMPALQKAINKWLPRGLEMFGDERGGATNVRYGLKPMKNAEAQDQYHREVGKLLRGLNLRYVRARLPRLSQSAAEALVDRVGTEGVAVEGIAPEDLLRLPHKDFFRRRGVPAFRRVGVDGRELAGLEDYTRHLAQSLPEPYLASKDFRDYLEAAAEVAAGTTTAEQAAGRMPELRRVAGSCPCSKSVRWVLPETGPQATVTTPSS
jgi:1,2-phenylacetyl-CoA epoxidase catalytic subunit